MSSSCRRTNGTTPEAILRRSLISKIIAAFAHNNLVTGRKLDHPLLPSKMIPGITLQGTTPVFFKVNVTAELATAIGGGAYPETPTIVYAHLPEIPRPDQRWVEGMRPLDSREVILTCYEAFKQLVH